MPTPDDLNSSPIASSQEDYQKTVKPAQKTEEWKAFKKMRGGRADVGECEVQILNLSEAVDRYEKQIMLLQRRHDDVQAKLTAALEALHRSDTALQLALQQSASTKAFAVEQKQTNRLVDILLALGAGALGFLPTFYSVVSRGSGANEAILATIVLVVVSACLMFGPSILMRGEKK